MMQVTMGKRKLKFFRSMAISPGSLPKYLRKGMESLKTRNNPAIIRTAPAIIKILPVEVDIFVVYPHSVF